MLRAISICSKHLAVQFPVITELGRGSEPANHIETWLTLCENWLCVERLWDGMTGADCILAFFRMVKQQRCSLLPTFLWDTLLVVQLPKNNLISCLYEGYQQGSLTHTLHMNGHGSLNPSQVCLPILPLRSFRREAPQTNQALEVSACVLLCRRVSASTVCICWQTTLHWLLRHR